MIKLKEMSKKQRCTYLALRILAVLIVIPSIIFMIRIFSAGVFEIADVLSETPFIYFILNPIMIFIATTLILVSRAYRLSWSKNKVHKNDSNVVIIGGSGIGSSRRNLILYLSKQIDSEQ